MTGLNFTEIDKTDAPLVVDDHVEGKNSPDGPDDFGLGLVKRVAVDDAVGRSGMLQDVRGVKGEDGILIGDTGCYHLSPSRISCHEVGLDEAGDNFDVGIDESPVEHDGDPRGSLPEIHMGFPVPRKMVDHPDRLKDLIRTDDLPQFIAFIGAVEAGGDHDQRYLLLKFRRR